MDRRALLSAIGGSVRALSGCVGDDAGADPVANGTDGEGSSDGDGTSEPLDVEALESLDAGDEMAAAYAVPEDLPAGRYVSRGLFGISWGVPDQTPEEHGAYPFELAITVG